MLALCLDDFAAETACGGRQRRFFFSLDPSGEEEELRRSFCFCLFKCLLVSSSDDEEDEEDMEEEEEEEEEEEGDGAFVSLVRFDFCAFSSGELDFDRLPFISFLSVFPATFDVTNGVSSSEELEEEEELGDCRRSVTPEVCFERPRNFETLATSTCGFGGLGGFGDFAVAAS